jgi:glycosyltransferase involved in cell wall biosynthesis
MPKIRGLHPDLKLVLIGAGPEERRIRDEVHRLSLDEVVEFPGKLPQQDIVEYLHRCRVAVVPSIIDANGETEGMPTVVVESMAAGVPVVGSRVNGIPDVIRHAENGWLCREKDPADLADKILDALNADQFALAEAVRETAAAYDWRRVADNYMEALEPLVGSGAPDLNGS